MRVVVHYLIIRSCQQKVLRMYLIDVIIHDRLCQMIFDDSGPIMSVN
jgi:hypothetical protein